MGHTHYFEALDWARTAAVLPAIVADARKIIAAVEVPVVGAFGDKGTVAVLDDETGIVLNGLGDDSYETFAFPGTGWDFCKTAMQPYDLIVTAILRRVQFHAGDAVMVSSDGPMAPDVYPANFTPGALTMEQVAAKYAQYWAPADRVVAHLFGKDTP